MPATFKQKNVVAAYAPSFKAQANLATALLSTDLTASLPLSRGNRPMPGIRKTYDETYECRGKYLIGRRLTSRLALWSLRFTDVSADFVAGILAMAMGAAAVPTGTGPHIHAISHGGSDDVPKTSFIIGTQDTDSDEPSELYSGMCVNRVQLAGEVRGKVSMDVDFVGLANPVVQGGFVFPACNTIIPVYSNDCALVINAVDYTADLRRFQYTFNNNLAIADDPFPFNATDAVRIERGDQAESSQFSFTLYGTKNHAVYVLAAADTTEAVSLRIGTATEGTTIAATGAQLTLQDTPIGYAGEANRSVINVDAIPFSVAGAYPDSVSASLARTLQYLV